MLQKAGYNRRSIVANRTSACMQCMQRWLRAAFYSPRSRTLYLAFTAA